MKSFPRNTVSGIIVHFKTTPGEFLIDWANAKDFPMWATCYLPYLFISQILCILTATELQKLNSFHKPENLKYSIPGNLKKYRDDLISLLSNEESHYFSRRKKVPKSLMFCIVEKGSSNKIVIKSNIKAHNYNCIDLILCFHSLLNLYAKENESRPESDIYHIQSFILFLTEYYLKLNIPPKRHKADIINMDLIMVRLAGFFSENSALQYSSDVYEELMSSKNI